ncbi:MAG TPA: magnesium transporter [Candidatus Ventricola gallistercoris]|nr:magnesium transporter [Candidatus Ventricola gallistercoris]
MELIRLLDEGKIPEFKEKAALCPPVDIAEGLEEITDEGRVLRIFRMLPKDISSDVFSYMTSEQQQLIAESATNAELRELVDDMFLDDTVDFLEEMPANVVKKVLQNTDENTRKTINQFLNYPENSAGSLMTIEYVDLHDYFTVRKAMDYIRRTGIDKETVYTCYVIDDQRKLVGQVSLRKLIIAPESTYIRDIMETNIVSASTTDDQEAVADDFRRYDLTSIAVCDKENRLVGIITIDDIVDVIQDENTEDIKKMAAIIPSDEDYLKASALSLVAHRLPWLLLLMISATFTSTIISHFEALLSGAVVLTAFIPMLMDSAGNSGSQTSVTVIRNMALGEIELRDWLRVLFKEVRVAIISGLALAAVNFLRMILFSSVSVLIAATVSVTLFCTVIIAMIVGCLLPMGAKRIGFDPAVMASPMITTIVDACSLLVYFMIASALLGL